MPSRSVKLTTPKQYKANMDASIELHGITANSLATKTNDIQWHMSKIRKFWIHSLNMTEASQTKLLPTADQRPSQPRWHLRIPWPHNFPLTFRVASVATSRPASWTKKRGSIWQSSRSCAIFFWSNLYLWLDKKTVGFCLYAECCLLFGQTHSPESVLFALSSSKGHSPKLHPADCKITFKMWQVK